MQHRRPTRMLGSKREHLEEKKAIERATAEAFLLLYNQQKGTSYQIVQHEDSPDIIAQNRDGQTLQLEIVLTEDRRGDIPASLGRSSGRTVQALKRNLRNNRAGIAALTTSASVLGCNVLDSLMRRLSDKFLKRYGPNTALVVRDTSGVDWDWDVVVEPIGKKLERLSNPFDRGVWIINKSKDRIFRIA